MNKKQILAAIVLVDFAAFSTWVVVQYGYLGLFAQALASPATIQVLLDLVIALTMVSAWMWRDAKRHGINPLPFLVLTITLGSIGPLAYLVRRLGRAEAVLPEPVEHVAGAPVHA
ncbi:DUF2834 domain-containing protein, partial [Candidatus Binatia bacterium]|nr:DUF2834 domain-containing protein [Candidatus Binatia bacterium]